MKCSSFKNKSVPLVCDWKSLSNEVSQFQILVRNCKHDSTDIITIFLKSDAELAELALGQLKKHVVLLALVFKVVCYTKLHPDLFPQLRGRDEAGLQETVKRANWPRLTSSYLSVLSAKFPVTLSIITLPFIVFFLLHGSQYRKFYHTWGGKNHMDWIK